MLCLKLLKNVTEKIPQENVLYQNVRLFILYTWVLPHILFICVRLVSDRYGLKLAAFEHLVNLRKIMNPIFEPLKFIN